MKDLAQPSYSIAFWIILLAYNLIFLLFLFILKNIYSKQNKFLKLFLSISYDYLTGLSQKTELFLLKIQVLIYIYIYIYTRTRCSKMRTLEAIHPKRIKKLISLKVTYYLYWNLYISFILYFTKGIWT